MSNLNDYFFLNYRNPPIDGHIQQSPLEPDIIRQLVRGKKNIMEIGFNAGHSSEVFLTGGATVTSFDFAEQKHCFLAKKYLDAKFPGAHTLIIGDSLKTVPQYAMANKTTFDVIFIDGAHDYPSALSDLENCAALASEDTLLIMDDVVYNPEWKMGYTEGSTRAWEEGVRRGLVQELGRFEEGLLKRGLVWGRYLRQSTPPPEFRFIICIRDAEDKDWIESQSSEFKCHARLLVAGDVSWSGSTDALFESVSILQPGQFIPDRVMSLLLENYSEPAQYTFLLLRPREAGDISSILQDQSSMSRMRIYLGDTLKTINHSHGGCEELRSVISDIFVDPPPTFSFREGYNVRLHRDRLRARPASFYGKIREYFNRGDRSEQTFGKIFGLLFNPYIDSRL